MPLADLSPEEFAALSTRLELAQQLGIATPPGSIQIKELAEWFMTSPEDMIEFESALLEKVRNLLTT